MVSVRPGIQPAFDVPQDGCKGGCIFSGKKYGIGDLDIGKAAVRVDDIAAPAGNAETDYRPLPLPEYRNSG